MSAARSACISTCAWHCAVADRTQLLRREQHGTDSSVRINDVFFAAHAACITLLTLGQCMVYERGAQRVHEHTRVAFAIVLPLTVTYAAAAWLFPADISVISCAASLDWWLIVKLCMYDCTECQSGCFLLRVLVAGLASEHMQETHSACACLADFCTT